ncbi:HpcH/HpaI aldolase family protein [Fusibacter bizertensis]
MNNLFSIREKIKSGKVSIGLFYKFNSQSIVEMIGYAGFDFIVIDMEHSNYSHFDTEGIIRTANGAGLSSIVRIKEAIAEDVLHALDSGADGVQIPSIKSLETAIEVCASTKYFPEGNRGLSLTQRSAQYNMWQVNNKENYYHHANENSLVVVHVENLEMAEKIDELLEIPQLDVIFIGPGDLSQALGKPGKMEDPELLVLIEGLFSKILAKGKAVGIYCGSSAAVERYVKMGATYITFGSDINVMASGLIALKESVDHILKSSEA